MATYNSNSQVGFLSFATTKSAFKNEGEPQSVSVTAKDTCDTLRRGGSICPHSSTMFTFPVLTSLKEAGVRTASPGHEDATASSACPYMEPRASGCLCRRNHYFQPQSGWVTLSHTTPTHCAQLQRFRIHIIQICLIMEKRRMVSAHLFSTLHGAVETKPWVCKTQTVSGISPGAEPHTKTWGLGRTRAELGAPAPC